MAETNEKVMSMVDQEIRKNSDITTRELYEKAQKVDGDIANLTIRQFNARYPLQVRRKLAPPRPRRRRRKKGGSDEGRKEVRKVMLDFARNMASAEDMSEVVDLVAGVDKYVDRVMKAAAK